MNTVNIQRHIVLVITFLFAFSINCYAGVDKKTGTMSYLDTDFEGVTRYYRNGDTVSGLFGSGWVSVYDNSLEISNSDTLFVFDAPAGKYYEFELDIDDLWQGTKGSIIESPEGLTWSYQDASYTFNSQGLLVGYINSEHDKYSLKYDQSGRVESFTAHGTSVYSVTTNDDGTISRLSLNDESELVEFIYSYKEGRLSSFVSPYSSIEYRYDDNGYIVYIADDNFEPILIGYQEFDNVIRVVSYNQGDDKETYRYEILSDTGDEKVFAVDYEVEQYGDNYKFRNEYYDVYTNGEFSYSKRIKKYQQGKLVFDATYLNQCFPRSITNRGEKTDFTYNASGLVTRKDSHDAIIEYTYNDNNKITYYQYTSKNEPENNRWVFFTYNDDNELVEAKNNQGKLVLFQYDNHRHITDMSVDDEILHFTYNDMDKPVRIEVLGLGALNVLYDEYGEVDKVEAEGSSHSLALKVTSSFTKMLDIVKPANIDFSF